MSEFDVFPTLREDYELLDMPMDETQLVTRNVLLFIPHISVIEGYERVAFDTRAGDMAKVGSVISALNVCRKSSTKEFRSGKNFTNKLWKRLTLRVKLPKVREPNHKRAERGPPAGLPPGKVDVSGQVLFYLRPPASGQVHLVEVGPNSQLVYLVPPADCPTQLDLSNGRFHRGQMLFLEQRVLQPNRIYAVPGGQWYLLATYQKSIFAVNVVSEVAAQYLPNLQNPTQEPLVQSEHKPSQPPSLVIRPPLSVPQPQTSVPPPQTSVPPPQTSVPEPQFSVLPNSEPQFSVPPTSEAPVSVKQEQPSSSSTQPVFQVPDLGDELFSWIAVAPQPDQVAQDGMVCVPLQQWNSFTEFLQSQQNTLNAILSWQQQIYEAVGKTKRRKLK